jgi:hypothetical protein
LVKVIGVKAEVRIEAGEGSGLGFVGHGEKNGIMDRFDNKYRGEIGCRISGQNIDF